MQSYFYISIKIEISKVALIQLILSLLFSDVLYLDENNLSGPIPSELGRLKRAGKPHQTFCDEHFVPFTEYCLTFHPYLNESADIRLHKNQLTGSIPPELGACDFLGETRCKRNLCFDSRF